MSKLSLHTLVLFCYRTFRVIGTSKYTKKNRKTWAIYIALTSENLNNLVYLALLSMIGLIYFPFCMLGIKKLGYFFLFFADFFPFFAKKGEKLAKIGKKRGKIGKNRQKKGKIRQKKGEK